MRAVLLGLAVLCAAACVEAQTFLPLPLSAPSLRTPLNAAYVGSTITGSLQPRLSWELLSEDRAVHFELQISADPSFKTLVMEFKSDEPSFTPPLPLDVSRTSPVGRRYYWKVRTCIELTCSEFSPARWFDLGRSSNDFNGDGYADILIGNDKQGAGSISVYLGHQGSLFTGPADGVISTGVDGHYFGSSHAAAGDFNGDGFADLVVGAPDYLEDRGRAYIYFGGALPDFLSGPDLQLVVPGEARNFGASVAGAGDVNSDGFSDVLVGAPSSDSLTGSAYIYFGGVSGALAHHDGAFYGELAFGMHGSDVASAGDINGDSKTDILISHDFFALSFSDRFCNSRAYFGGAGSIFDSDRKWSLFHHDDQSTCTMRAGAAGDVNDDGFADVLLATHNQTELVEVLLDLGSHELSSRAARPVLPFAEGVVYTFASIDDVNGDELIDFAVSSQYQDQYRTLIYFGYRDSEGFKLRDAAKIIGASAVANGGDINGDGFGDLIVSYPAERGTGRAQLFLGAAGERFDTAPDGTLTGLEGFRVLNKSLPARAY